MTERFFLERFPGLINDQENVDGICKFIPYYKHLNDLIEKWEARAEYDVHHSPSPCRKINPDSKFMLFGIKESFKDLNVNHNKLKPSKSQNYTLRNKNEGTTFRFQTRLKIF